MNKIENNAINSSHSLSLQAKTLSITAVKEVVSATDKTILAKLVDKLIIINGRDLRVHKLNLEQALLIVEGNIESFKYQGDSNSKVFFKRLFK